MSLYENQKEKFLFCFSKEPFKLIKKGVSAFEKPPNIECISQYFTPQYYTIQMGPENCNSIQNTEIQIHLVILKNRCIFDPGLTKIKSLTSFFFAVIVLKWKTCYVKVEKLFIGFCFKENLFSILKPICFQTQQY